MVLHSRDEAYLAAINVRLAAAGSGILSRGGNTRANPVEQT